jgi:hypothetical protein
MTIKLLSIPVFPSDVTGDGIVTVTRQNGAYRIGVDFSLLATDADSTDNDQLRYIAYNQLTREYELLRLIDAITAGLSPNVSAFLETPTSANLKAAVTDETGSGSLVFSTSPNITTPTGIVKGDVGLGNVDNTSDASKPISTAQAAANALNLKIASNLADLANAAMARSNIGLGNVDNTSDATKNAAAAALTNKNLNSGTNTFPTFNQNTTGSAASFTGSLSGDVTGTQSATVVGKINGTSLAGLATGILKNTAVTGVPSIAAAADFPTLNQNTTGSAATLTTPRTIDGQSFNGSANITVVAPGTHAATSKTTPIDADEMPLVDSASSNVLAKLTWANLKAAIKTYYDSLGTTLTNKTISGASNTLTVRLANDVTGTLPLANGGTNASSATAALTNLGLSADGKSLVAAANFAAMRPLFTLGVGTFFRANQTYTAGGGEQKILIASSTALANITLDTTNNRAVITKAGTYMLGAQIYATPVETGKVYTGIIKINGASPIYFSCPAAATGPDQSVALPMLTLNLAVNDYIEIWAYSSAAANFTLLGGSTYFTLAQQLV